MAQAGSAEKRRCASTPGCAAPDMRFYDTAAGWVRRHAGVVRVEESVRFVKHKKPTMMVLDIHNHKDS